MKRLFIMALLLASMSCKAQVDTTFFKVTVTPGILVIFHDSDVQSAIEPEQAFQYDSVFALRPHHPPPGYFNHQYIKTFKMVIQRNNEQFDIRRKYQFIPKRR